MSHIKGEVMITGAGGALSRKVIESLSQAFSLVLVDFRQRNDISGIPSYCVDYDKRGFEDIFRKHDISAVIHLGRMGGEESTHRNRYNHNVLGTKRLLDLCCKYDISQVIVLSTYYVYGASPYNASLISEDQPLKASELTMDLVDTVELDNLASIYLWKYPELNVTILRPCNIAGPGVMNSMSLLLQSKYAPVLAGFSPIMQFIHIDDMAKSIELAFRKNIPGVYNVSPGEFVAYQRAITQSGCTRLYVPPLPESVPKRLSSLLGSKMWPSYLINFNKFPVVIDGSLFDKTFGFRADKSHDDIFRSYSNAKIVGAGSSPQVEKLQGG